MDEILSQTEIDRLLKAVGTGEVKLDQINTYTRAKVKNYDFKRPNKFSKNQINTLHYIFDNYARSLASNLSGSVQTVVETHLVSIEQLTYSEFIRSLDNPTVVSVCELNPLGTVLFDISPTLAFVLLDLLLGGQGESVNGARDLTQIERLLVEKRARAMVEMLPEAWENIFPLTVNLLSLETNPQFVQIVSAAEMVALITIGVGFGSGNGFIHICLPYVIMEPVLPKLSTQVWFTNKQQKSVDKESIRKKLDKVHLDINVVLGSASLNVKELLNLGVGDVLPLDKRISEPVEVVLGSEPKFLGIPGSSGGRMAVQITGLVDKGDEHNE